MSRILATNEKPTDPAAIAWMGQVRKNWQSAVRATIDIRSEALDDIRFKVGEQWDPEIKRGRIEDKRPCLTINRLPNFIRQICNDQRDNRPDMIVNPVDDEADADTADVIQGMLRHIEYESNAEACYDRSFENMVDGGFGYLRVLTEYDNPMSFKQVLKIKHIRNQFSVYFDPEAEEPDYSDAKWVFIMSDMTKESYKEEYPQSKLAQMQDWTAVGDSTPGWLTADSCRVAEYFVIERTRKEIVKLSDGTVHFKEDFEKNADGTLKTREGVLVMDTRWTHIPKVKWYKLNGLEKLDDTDWLGMYLPVVPVLGTETIVDGKVVLEGAIRHAKDPQRMYNYWASAETEMIALAPKAPFIGAEGQFEGYEKQWQQANNRSFPYLQYKMVSLGDKPAPPPTRNTYEPAVQAITQARMQSVDDLKSTFGIYDPGLGMPGNETSGKAILARQNKSDKSNAHYTDNFKRSIKHLAKVLMDLIPKVYNEADVQQIVTPSGDHKQVKINQPIMVNGVQKIYNVTAGKYNVVVSTGPSYQTKRQEAAASIEQFVQAWPEMIQYTGDLLVKNMDWPGAQEIAARLKKMLPAALQDSQDGQPSPQATALIQKLQGVIQNMGAELTKLQTKLDTRVLDIQSKERIALVQAQVSLINKQMEVSSKEGIIAFTSEIDHIQHLLNAFGAGSDNPAEAATGAAQTLTPQTPTPGSHAQSVLPSSGNSGMISQ